MKESGHTFRLDTLHVSQAIDAFFFIAGPESGGGFPVGVRVWLESDSDGAARAGA